MANAGRGPDIPTEEEAILEKAKRRSRFGDWIPGRIAERGRMFEDLRDDAAVGRSGFLAMFLDQLVLWVILPIVVSIILVLFFVLVRPELPS